MSFYSRVLGVSASLALGFASFTSAGDVKVELKGTALQLTGDDLGARLLLTGLAEDGSHTIVPAFVRVVGNGTTFNGLDQVLTFDGVESVSLSLGDGFNVVQLEFLVIGKGVTIKRGSGQDSLAVTSASISGNLSVNGGAGALDFDCTGARIGGKLSVKGSPEDDSASTSCNVNGDVQISLGDGADLVTFAGPDLALGRSVSIKTGRGPDGLSIRLASVGKSLAVDLGDGSNGVVIGNTSVGGAFTYKSGKDADILVVESLEAGRQASFDLGDGVNSAQIRGASISGGLSIKGRSGSDDVTFANPFIEQQATINLGDGFNHFAFGAAALANPVVRKKFSYLGGKGTDSVFVSAVGFPLGASFALGAGVNELSLFSVPGKSISVSAGNDGDTAALREMQIDDDMKLQMGGGNNRVILQNARIADALTITAGPGDDAVAFEDSVLVGGKTKLSLGGGTNSHTTP